jgi:RNA 3'-terminal phosphate cyclase (ATP)
MLTIDGSQGEGGGQVLRTSLALSLVTGTPFRIERIRAARRTPGLLRQHLTAVRAAAEVGGAEVSGVALGSSELAFRPTRVRPGEYAFSIGTAGSTSLVLQSVLPALVLADAPSTIALEGGTHNPAAPPFDFLARAFAPLLERMGPRVALTLERAGFFPAGGGRVAVAVEPAASLEPFDLTERGALVACRARAAVANLPFSIAEREIAVLAAQLPEAGDDARAETIAGSHGPGNVVTVEVASERVTEVFTGFGARGVPAETVAARAAAETRRYLDAGVAVGEHLADQLVLLMALAGKGAFTTVEPSSHTRTNVAVIGRFLDVRIRVSDEGDGVWSIRVG